MQEIDPWFLDDDEVRVALAARDIGALYRLLKRLGVTQRQIAGLTGQSQSEVCEILKGRQVLNVLVLDRIINELLLAEVHVRAGEPQGLILARHAIDGVHGAHRALRRWRGGNGSSHWPPHWKPDQRRHPGTRPNRPTGRYNPNLSAFSPQWRWASDGFSGPLRARVQVSGPRRRVGQHADGSLAPRPRSTRGHFGSSVAVWPDEAARHAQSGG
jgi:hypothetical protein